MALSSLGTETGSGCRRVGRGLASHDDGRTASNETAGRGHVGGGAFGHPRGWFRPFVPLPLATDSGAAHLPCAPRPIRTRPHGDRAAAARARSESLATQGE